MQIMEGSQSEKWSPNLEQDVVSSMSPDPDSTNRGDDVVEEEENESHLNLNEDKLRQVQKVNSISAIDSLRISPKGSS